MAAAQLFEATTNRTMVSAVRGALKRRFEQEERVGGDVTCRFSFRRQMECEKNKNREGNEASDFDGFCWMRGCNNQPKVGRIVGVYLGETVRRRRAMMIGEDAVASFRPSDFWEKNTTKFVVA
jgi:hypothetical protein